MYVCWKTLQKGQNVNGDNKKNWRTFICLLRITAAMCLKTSKNSKNKPINISIIWWYNTSKGAKKWNSLFQSIFCLFQTFCCWANISCSSKDHWMLSKQNAWLPFVKHKYVNHLWVCSFFEVGTYIFLLQNSKCKGKYFHRWIHSVRHQYLWVLPHFSSLHRDRRST